MTARTVTPTTPGTTDVRWGIAATGGIAATVADDLATVPGATLAAVASRSLDRARAFADAHGVARAHGSYADLVADPDVDVVYVATPHAQHAGIATAALDAGTAVLVEKPLTSSLAATAAVVARARERGVFAMEALWTRFQPLVVRLRELLADGVVGDVRTLTGHIGFRARGAGDAGGPGADGAGDRFWDPALGGGALLDLGVYPVALAQMLFGDPETVATSGTLSARGVDAEVGLLLGHAGGQQSLLSASLLAPQPRGAVVVGTGGHVVIEGQLHRPDRLVVHREGAHEPLVVTAADVDDGAGGPRGYGWQVRHVHECLAAGLVESPVMPLADTLGNAAVLERALVSLGAVRSAEAA